MIASRGKNIWILIMRFSPAAIALSLTFAIMSSVSISGRGDDDGGDLRGFPQAPLGSYKLTALCLSIA